MITASRVRRVAGPDNYYYPPTPRLPAHNTASRSKRLRRLRTPDPSEMSSAPPDAPVKPHALVPLALIAAVLGISISGPLVRLSHAEPLAIAVWRMASPSRGAAPAPFSPG